MKLAFFATLLVIMVGCSEETAQIGIRTYPIEGNTLAVRFEGLDVNPVLNKVSKVTWDFGDGSTFEGTDAIHTYEKAGQYMVKMSAEYNTDKKSSITINVKVPIVH